MKVIDVYRRTDRQTDNEDRREEEAETEAETRTDGLSTEAEQQTCKRLLSSG